MPGKCFSATCRYSTTVAKAKGAGGFRIGAHLNCQSVYPLGLGSFFAFFVPFARANNRHFPFRDELFVMHSFEVFLQARTVNDLNGVLWTE
jgi:hypothetical protein